MADWLEPQEPTATASPSAWPACPPPRDPQAPLAPGSRVDRYEVIELLGEGSMGAVYLAHDLDLGREVALKRIKPGRVDLWRAQTRLHREAQTMARIEHAAVVRVYSVGIADGQLFIAMELARGGSVAAWARASRRSWRDVISVFVDAGRGLAAAHRAGIVHRDIKPSNLLIDSHGRAKVSDFGVARVLEGGGDDGSRDDDDDARGAMAPGATHTGGVVGTLEYMPPEQLIGGPIDPRADQFSFCVALWTVLSGQRPFRLAPDECSSSSPEPFHRAIVTGQIAPVHGQRGVPRRILALLRRGLAADRAARWPAMDELLDALEGAARPRMMMWWWIAAAVVMSVAISGAAVWMAPRGIDETRVATAVAGPGTCGARDQIGAVWNATARSAYLASGRNAEFARQDVEWFDDYARALDRAYSDACGHAAPAMIQCLEDAGADLRAALVRHEREYWPRLRAIDRCGSSWHERDIGALSNDENALFSLDAKYILLSKAHNSQTIRSLDNLTQQPFDLARPVRWLADGSILGGSANGVLMIVDPKTSVARTLGTLRGSLIDVSADLALAAVREIGRFRSCRFRVARRSYRCFPLMSSRGSNSRRIAIASRWSTQSSGQSWSLIWSHGSTRRFRCVPTFVGLG
jgi:hypothetical protein